MDYIDIITHFISPIVQSIETVKIEKVESNSTKDCHFVISCTKEDMGRLIGKHGSTANALREVVSIAAKNNNQHVHIKIVSLEDNVKEEINDEENPQ